MPKQRTSNKDLLEQAQQLEAEDRLPEAAGYYTKVITADPLNTHAYNRLMIIFRKQKEYRKELTVINKAIKTYEDSMRQEQQAWLKNNRKMARLSKALAHSLGLIDPKGKPLHEDRMVSTWRKRRELVTQKLKRST
ncbi:hypothetical protein F0L74_29400 [Chitinophaga agrisoli]|uniref:Uncharacterized protein n=1 Tax=Chitinophaga agrisoli TaxID=2607653 RepID=A0A5B2VL30_9BACT|nr:hypothetical protein [Chitinophaga agrisoli]KAA2240283.1 hypothetical protein F0L74_29400 [Chitinophaga agrisoli]